MEKEIKEIYDKYIMDTYSRLPVDLKSGKSATAADKAGKEYIDFGSGIGVNSLGYCNDDWVNAVCGQAKMLQHASNYYYNEPAGELAQLLCESTGYDKVLFCNSGAEANECGIKIARKYSFDKYGKESGRNKILTLKNSFHGRTVTTLAATGQDVFHDFFFPFTEGFAFAEPNDFSGVKEELSKGCYCAVMFEFIQGEGGVCPLEQGFVNKLFEYCRENDILTLADEVQTGIGRTGKLLTSEHYGVKPDITTLAKGLGGGLPIGAVICTKKTSQVLKKGQHGTTFGGNPVVCAGGVAVLKKLTEKGFLDSVLTKGELLKKELLSLNGVCGVDGKGLMLGIRLKGITALDALNECVQKGLLPLTAKEKLRLLPPLNITDDELLKGIEILKSVLDKENDG